MPIRLRFLLVANLFLAGLGITGYIAVRDVQHASDVFSWGLFWAVALGVVFTPCRDSEVRAVKILLILLALFAAAALLAGPERVRVFAENGTLLNRLLLQLWPAAALLVLTELRGPSPLTGRGA